MPMLSVACLSELDCNIENAGKKWKLEIASTEIYYHQKDCVCFACLELCATFQKDLYRRKGVDNKGN